MNGLSASAFDKNNHGDKDLLEISHPLSETVEIVYVFRYHVTQQGVTYRDSRLSHCLCNMAAQGEHPYSST